VVANNIKNGALTTTSESVNEVGATFVLKRKGLRDLTRLEVGRTVAPSTSGGIYRADQFQIQYDYSLSLRMELRSAALFYRQRALSGASSGGDHDYLNTEVVLRWAASRTWFVAGGPRYIRTRNAGGSASANNTAVFLSVGYQGIGR
jgi:hypothetical protein